MFSIEIWEQSHQGRFANILMMRKHLVKLKQTWIAEKEFNVLYNPN